MESPNALSVLLAISFRRSLTTRPPGTCFSPRPFSPTTRLCILLPANHLQVWFMHKKILLYRLSYIRLRLRPRLRLRDRPSPLVTKCGITARRRTSCSGPGPVPIPSQQLARTPTKSSSMAKKCGYQLLTSLPPTNLQHCDLRSFSWWRSSVRMLRMSNYILIIPHFLYISVLILLVFNAIAFK